MDTWIIVAVIVVIVLVLVWYFWKDEEAPKESFTRAQMAVMDAYAPNLGPPSVPSQRVLSSAYFNQ